MAKRRRPSKAAVALRAWLAAKEKSQAWLAIECGVVQGAVSAWLLGSAPRIEHALVIQRLTRIPIAAWAEEPATVAKAG